MVEANRGNRMHQVEATGVGGRVEVLVISIDEEDWIEKIFAV